jgi:hypothetical protein
MDNERMRRRLEWRRSNAAAPRRNRQRERKTGQAPWEREDFHDMCCGEELCDCDGGGDAA